MTDIQRSIDLISPRTHEAVTTAIDLLLHRLDNKVTMSGGRASWGHVTITTNYDQDVMHINAMVPVADVVYETGHGDTP